jgi:hypothetical protein
MRTLRLRRWPRFTLAGVLFAGLIAVHGGVGAQLGMAGFVALLDACQHALRLEGP